MQLGKKLLHFFTKVVHNNTSKDVCTVQHWQFVWFAVVKYDFNLVKLASTSPLSLNRTLETDF